MYPPPAITGMGLVTPLGDTAARTWDALLTGRFIRDHARVTIDVVPHETRITAMAARVAREAVMEAGWNTRDVAADDSALVVGTSKGPVEGWITPPLHMSDGAYVHAGRSSAFGLSTLSSEIAAELGWGFGPRLTLSAACTSGLHALARGAMLIAEGYRRVLVVAAEASVHPLFVGSFRRLGVLPPEGLGCRPFDVHRAGFLMSEAAAGVCLESAEHFSMDRRPAIARVERFALGGDATHLTRGDDNAATIRRLLRHVIGMRPVDLMHAHGTGTELNDPAELAAIQDIAGNADAPPVVYSHKGALGHSLGAAGLVSIVINCLAHRDGIVPANVQTRRPLPTRGVILSNERMVRPVRRSIALAAGFGGPTAVIGLTSP